MRLVIAGVVGGLVMFFWGAFSHMVLGLGSSGMKNVPNEAAVVASIKGNITEPGLYFIPGMENMNNPSEADQKAWEEKYKAGPRAIVIYQSDSVDGVMSPKMLLIELASNIVAALFVAYILSMMVASFSKRVIAAALIGLTGWVSINLSYWNWYGFPPSFVIPEAIDQTVGWLLSGLAIAFIIRQKEPAAA